MKHAYSFNRNPSIEIIDIGQHQLIAIDNFLDDPEEMIKFAECSKFYLYPKYEERKGYPGIRAISPEDFAYDLTVFLEPLIKKYFNIPDALNIRKSVCAFSLVTLPAQALGPLQRTPHFDASTPNHIASLIYLCDESHGGTAFYRHNSTGIQQVTEENREHFLDVYYEEINANRPPLKFFEESDEYYTRLAYLPARFNRLVLYRGSLLHTAVVNPERSVNPDPKTGRLTINTFYDF